MPFFCDGGVIVRGLLPCRPTDSISFGAAYGKFSADLAAAQEYANLRGIIFYLGDVVVPFGKNLWAVPVPMAWN